MRPKQACPLAFIVFHMVCVYPDSLGSAQCQNFHQTVKIIIWFGLVCEHDTQCKFNFTQIAEQIQFTKKCSFYITLSVDLLFVYLLIIITLHRWLCRYLLQVTVHFI